MANHVPPQVNIPPDVGSPVASAAGDLSSLGSPRTGRASPTGGSNQVWVGQNAHTVTGLATAIKTHISSDILALLPAQFQGEKGFAEFIRVIQLSDIKRHGEGVVLQEALKECQATLQTRTHIEFEEEQKENRAIEELKILSASLASIQRQYDEKTEKLEDIGKKKKEAMDGRLAAKKREQLIQGELAVWSYDSAEEDKESGSGNNMA
jgi:hypothetical protein